jgi:hypothetical protein
LKCWHLIAKTQFSSLMKNVASYVASETLTKKFSQTSMCGTVAVIDTCGKKYVRQGRDQF